MYKIIDERGSGKTSRLMLIAKENNAMFVCKNVEHMKQKAYGYGITGIDFISYEEFFDGYPQGEYVVDELEDFVKFIFQKQRLIGYTLSK